MYVEQILSYNAFCLIYGLFWDWLRQLLLISEVFMTQTKLKILYFMSYHHMRNNLIGINDIQPVDSIFVFAEQLSCGQTVQGSILSCLSKNLSDKKTVSIDFNKITKRWHQNLLLLVPMALSMKRWRICYSIYLSIRKCISLKVIDQCCFWTQSEMAP